MTGLRLREGGRKIRRTDNIVGIPLIAKPSAQTEEALKQHLGNYEIREAVFELLPSRPRNLHDVLSWRIPSDLLQEVSRSFDAIGQIAIIEIPPALRAYSTEIGEAVLELHPHLRLVVRKSGDVEGRFRIRVFQVVAGSGTTETVHHEFGCAYNLDVRTVYFNPRLSNERRRVAETVKPREVLVDMFAGVGPYSILIAKLQPTCRVYSVDINPSAVQYLEQNVLANKVADRVLPLLGDARQLSRKDLQGVADRVIMNLPAAAGNYLDAALQTLKPAGGVVNFYQFAQRGVDLDTVQSQFLRAVETRRGRVGGFTFCKVIREVAPGRVQVALDATIK